MGLIARMAGEVGAAVGTYQRHLRRALGRVRRPNFLTAWADSERWRGGDWTQRNAQRRSIQSSWYFAAISALIDVIIQAKFQVVEHLGPDEDPVQIPNHALERLIRRPNPFMGRAFLWEYSYWWFRLDGNFFWFVSCDGAGRPAELWPLPAVDVTPVPGDKERFIDYYEYLVYGQEYRIPAEYVVHVRRPNPFNIFDGLSDLVPGMLPIDSDLAMSRWNGAFFGRDNVMPSAIINLSSGDSKQPIDPVDAQSLKDDLRSEYQAFRRKTAVTSAYKVEVEPLGWNNRDMDFVSGRGFTKEEIWAISRVHAGAFDPNSTEANANVGERRIRETAWGDLTRISEQLTSDLVVPFYGEQYEASFEDIRIADRQLELQEVDRARGVLTVDEVRQKYYSEAPLGDERGGSLYGEAAPAQAPIPYFNVDGPRGFTQNPGAPENPGFLAPDTGQREALEAARADLRRWQAKALKAVKSGKHAGVSFESDWIPFELSEATAKLLSTSRDPAYIKTVFDHAYKALGAAPRPWRPWSVFENRLIEEIASFSEDEAGRLRDITERNPDGLNDESIWLDHEQRFVNKIKPVLEGLSQTAIQQVREAAGAQVPDTVNWELINRNAAQYARQNAADLVAGVTDTTRERIRRAVADSIDAGEGSQELAARVEEIVDDPGRARMIAISESTSTFAEANDAAWGALGYPPAVFLPTAHPNCRCYIQPGRLDDGSKAKIWYTVRDERVCREPITTPWGVVEGCRALHLVVISEGPMLGQKLR